MFTHTLPDGTKAQVGGQRTNVNVPWQRTHFRSVNELVKWINLCETFDGAQAAADDS